MVDSGRSADTVLELSHWPGNNTPESYKADTSSEIVLKFLRSTERNHFFNLVDAVSTDHYDVDGLLALWSVLYPDEALRRAELIVQTAVTGDFDRFTTAAAVQTCLSLDGLERERIQPSINYTAWSTEEITANLYQQALALVPSCLDHPEEFRPLWNDEYHEVLSSIKILEQGKARLTEIPELDLAILESDRPLHDLAVYNATHCLRVLTVVGGSIYCIRYRYESFVELDSRPASSRVPLDTLTARLNACEKNSGRWFAESIATAHPRLQLYSQSRVPGVSSIPADAVVEMLCDGLKTGIESSDFERKQGFGWMNDATVPKPPSLRPS
jgi:hypothetical protein